MAEPPLMVIDTPLGDDLLILGLRATIELGRLAHYDVTLVSKKADIDLRKLLGKHVKIGLALAGAKRRVFGGYVVRFRLTGMRGRLYLYRAEVRPWLWLLTRRTNCRMFQNRNVEDIVKAIFNDPVYAGVEFGEIRWKVNARLHPAREYCVQYRESDFNFVSRLLEDEGIYYWFQDRDGKDALVLTDSLATHEAAQGCESLPYGLTLAAQPGAEYISEWQAHYEIETHNWVLTDYDFKHPSRSLQKKAVKTMPGFDAFGKLEHFDFPGGYVDPDYGDSRVKARADERWSDDGSFNWHQVEARTNARGVRVGALLRMERHPRGDQNAQYLVTRACHEVDLADYEAFEGAQATRYECRFNAIDAQQHFAPPRLTRKPFVQGPQTAVVVGPAGDEIFTDKYGRVKVQFVWDREGKSDENSSCWIRVSQPWSGKGWGAVSIPRIGQEVIVDFLEGDPDRPIITGRVYNATQMPPYGLPGGAVVSGVKSQTHKGSGYNEISLDDTAGGEKVTIHGQHDMATTVEHDQRSTVRNNRTDHVQMDDRESVGNNQHQTVGVLQIIKVGSDRSVDIGGNHSRTVALTENVRVNLHRMKTIGINETVHIGAIWTQTVGAATILTVGGTMTQTVRLSLTQSVGAGKTVKITGDLRQNVSAAKNEQIGGAFTLSVGDAMSETVKAAKTSTLQDSLTMSVKTNRSETVGETYKLHAKKICVSADEMIELVVGESLIKMEKSGISIKAKKISVTSDGTISTNSDGKTTIKGSQVLVN